uniref:UPF0261 domain-containing protein n=1 Tax=Nonomuraea gerenzanensis TaxID=93944 RepID=A0A1M4E4Q3_9ACTN|nr:Tm-1-like ATP-binding domain-containing protein [Nonomuraea gerenzanensis]SBO93748.1 hypothetical protein BN4615_P3262 [Nonomuraea gerenzanensis]
MAVLLLGTLDTKGTEYAYVRDLVAAAGQEVVLLDAGVMGAPARSADVTAPSADVTAPSADAAAPGADAAGSAARRSAA